jgi:hypothetical protein
VQTKVVRGSCGVAGRGLRRGLPGEFQVADQLKSTAATLSASPGVLDKERGRICRKAF